MASGELVAISQVNAALGRAFAELESAKVATVLSSFPLLQWPAKSAQRLLFHPQLPHPEVSALTGLAVAPTSTFVKVQHLATAVALRGSAARPLVTVKRVARLHSARVPTPAYHQTEHAEGPTNTNAKDLVLATAVALRATADRLPVTALPDARLHSEPAHLPMSRQTGPVEGQRVMSAKVLNLVTAVARLDTVARLVHTALLAASQHSVHAPLLTSHQMAHAAAQRSTSAKVQATVIAAVLQDTVGSLRTTAARAVSRGSAHALR